MTDRALCRHTQISLCLSFFAGSYRCRPWLSCRSRTRSKPWTLPSSSSSACRWCSPTPLCCSTCSSCSSCSTCSNRPSSNNSSSSRYLRDRVWRCPLQPHFSNSHNCHSEPGFLSLLEEMCVCAFARVCVCVCASLFVYVFEWACMHSHKSYVAGVFRPACHRVWCRRKVFI